MTTILDHALAYAGYGWRVVPLHHLNAKGACTCCRTDCPTPGKHPRIVDWPAQATTDPERIRAWWSRWPDANVGIALGDGLVDIETEAYGDGAENLARLEAVHGQLPDTVSWTSGGGGCHRLFRTDQPIRNAVSIGQTDLHLERTAIDVRGVGGLAVLPPSNHASGSTYRWGNLAPDAMEVEALPDTWAVFLLAEREQPVPAQPGSEGAIPEGQRNQALARQAGVMRRAGMSEQAIAAALAQTNAERCRPPLPEAEVRAIARSIARYEPDQAMVAAVECHWQQDSERATTTAPTEADPGPIPPELLRVPGFIGMVMDHCLATAPYPNQAMAFCGALSLQAFLAGRKVREPGGLRTNLYLLGLAHSSSGKDWPRKLNTRILHHVGLSDQLGDRFASGEGLQDALQVNPAMLFQTDEIDGMLQSINKSQDARHEGIMGALLTFYTSADSVVPMRRKAGQTNPGVIDQPCLVVFGTAIPNHYYEALSRRMLTNGFFARMIVVEGGKRGEGKDAGPLDPPQPILDIAKHWADLAPGGGNLGAQHPSPAVVPVDESAAAILAACRTEADAAYAACEGRNDSVGTTVWGRVNEQARRLALLHAISANHLAPVIDAAAATWATRFVLHQTRRMLFMASGHVAENPFHADCLRLLERLRAAPGGELPHGVLLKRMKVSARMFEELVGTLVQAGELNVRSEATAGRPKIVYTLPTPAPDEGKKGVKEAEKEVPAQVNEGVVAGKEGEER